MIKVLISPSCHGCRKTLKFFTDNDIPFKEFNIIAGQVNKAIIKDILFLTENGSEDIISSRSKAVKKSKVSINDLSFDQLYELIERYPTMLKRPIILQTNHLGNPKRLMVGYNANDIEIFLRDKAVEKHFYASNMHCYGSPKDAKNFAAAVNAAAANKPAVKPPLQKVGPAELQEQAKINKVVSA